jgi:ADP-ribose pyrophosphatase
MSQDAEHLLWSEQSRRKLGSYNIFDLFVSERRAADGRSGRFYLLSAPDWVNVVPVIRDADGRRRFVMVRQYRHGADMVTTEFPAGLVSPGEKPEETAARELAEETGRTAGRLTALGKIRPNPAFLDNWCHVFLAEDLSEPGERRLDEMELLDVREVWEEELVRNVGTGEYVNSLVMAALLWYTLHKA